MKRRILVLAVVLAVAAGVAYYVMNHVEKEIILTGIVTTDDVIANAQISGRLGKLLVKQGDEVKKGQLLAEVEAGQWQADMAFFENSRMQMQSQVEQAKTELKFQEMQTNNQIAQAEANLAAAQAQVAQGTAELENLRLTFEREEGLYKKQVESQQAYDQARTGFDAGKAHVNALEKQVAAAQAAVELAKSTLQQVAARRAAVEMDEHQLAAAGAQRDKAQVQLGYTEIRSPVNGVVDQRGAMMGEVVNPGQAIVTLIDLDDLWVRADVEETYVSRIKRGDHLSVRLPSGDTMMGEVFYIAVDADFATQRDVSRTKRDIKTFEVRLRCDNKERKLAVGMTAYVTLPLVAPASAAAGTE